MITREELLADPEVAANITRLVEATGIPRARYEALLRSDPPGDIPLAHWLDALATRGRAHGPWPESALRDLSRRVNHQNQPAASARSERAA